jgi:hypothetical protein
MAMAWATGRAPGWFQHEGTHSKVELFGGSGSGSGSLEVCRCETKRFGVVLWLYSFGVVKC